MATLEQIEQLLDRKLNEKFENFRKEITDDFKLITDDIKLTIEENKKNIAGNTTTLENLSGQFEEMKQQHQKTIDDLQKQLTKQNDDIDELTNRTMRANIVIRGLPEVAKEDTKEELCNYLATLSGENPDVVFDKIDRAHRTPGPPRDDGKPRNVFANLDESVESSLSEMGLFSGQNQFLFTGC